MRPENPDVHEVSDSSTGMPIPVKVVKKEEPLRVTDRRFWAQEENTTSETQDFNYSFKPSYVEELEKKLADSELKVQEVLTTDGEKKADATAEAQRARERIQNEYNRRLSQAKTDIVGKFMDVLENFERALAAAKSNPGFDSLLEGVQLIRNQ